MLLHHQQIKRKSTRSRSVITQEILSRARPAQECSLSSEQRIPVIPPSLPQRTLPPPPTSAWRAEQLQHSPPLCSTRTYRQSSDYGHPLNYRPRITRGDRRHIQNADEMLPPRTQMRLCSHWAKASAPINATVLVCAFVG